MNFLISTDAYKGCHYKLFPADTEAVRYYMAPRKPISEDHKEFVLFGISNYIYDYLDSAPSLEDVKNAKALWNKFNVGGGAYPFPFHAFEKALDVYGEDYMFPINIYGLPEGSVCRKYNKPVMVVECENKDFLFLPGFIETALQRDAWYGSTVATISRNVKVFLEQMYRETVDPEFYWTIDSRLHDFGGRGVSSSKGAANGGLAHLINFKGTDTMEAIQRGMDIYGIEPDELACSIPAAEHSTVTSWGEGLESEKAALKHMISVYGNNPLIAFVSDSYDFKRMVDKGWNDPEIIEMIRKCGVMPVCRPDSGDPTEMVLYALEGLEKGWGSTKNNKGYKILNGISVIQGDGMDHQKIVDMYLAVKEKGYSAQNVAVGMGGGLLQKLNRDTMSWSMKMYKIKRNGVWYNVQKTPVTQKDKESWNPMEEIDNENWVAYYRGNRVNQLYPDLKDYERDFKKIRERASIGII